mmetsp:Transcript_58629/g.164491  ORF Transcript_58629/g.164491 Transcript_58629/m.164491 type:complete len:232 (+) Transcript_58629:3-698(+)
MLHAQRLGQLALLTEPHLADGRPLPLHGRGRVPRRLPTGIHLRGRAEDVRRDHLRRRAPEVGEVDVLLSRVLVALEAAGRVECGEAHGLQLQGVGLRSVHPRRGAAEAVPGLAAPPGEAAQGQRHEGQGRGEERGRLLGPGLSAQEAWVPGHHAEVGEDRRRRRAPLEAHPGGAPIPEPRRVASDVEEQRPVQRQDDDRGEHALRHGPGPRRSADAAADIAICTSARRPTP